MPDNTILNSGSGGDTVRDLARQAGTVKTQVVQLDAGGASSNAELLITARPDGFLRTQVDPTTLLFDTFETLNTTDTWTPGGTNPPSAGTGTLVVNAAAIASATSYARSQAVFIPGSSAYLQYAALIQIDGAASTGTNRFWGLGVFGAPSLTAPITNGVVFEVDTTGALFGSVYAGGVRTQTVAIAKPTDGAVHRYAIYYKTSRVYFELDNVQVGSLPFPNPVVAALATVIGQVNGATLTGTNSLSATLIGVGDTGRNATKLADGAFPWRTVSVGKSGGLSVKGGTIAGTIGTIAAAGTGTVGPVDVSEAGNVTFTVKNSVAASAYAGAPVLVFEQSDDNVSWGPVNVTRSDTGSSASTFTLGPNTANGSLMFDVAAEGVNWMRVRVTTGPTTNGMAIVVSGGGMPFSPVVSITPQPITKGVQGAAGITTQDLKDSGRVNVAISCYQAAGVITTEALFAATIFAVSRDGAAAVTANSFAVTAGKRLRLQTVEVSVKNNAAAAGTSKIALRYSAAGGAITTASPILALWDIGSNNAVAGNYLGPFVWSPPDGVELLGGATFAITNLSSAATMLHTFTLTGYEY